MATRAYADRQSRPEPLESSHGSIVECLAIPLVIAPWSGVEETALKPLIVKALSLHQPWASLIAAGVKSIETRSWPPPKSLIGQRIGIHAAKKAVAFPDTPVCREFNDAVNNALGHDWLGKIPTGVVVAIAILQNSRQVQGDTAIPQGDELLFGDFTLGRWLWELSGIQPLDPPVPARGHQGLWNFEMPQPRSVADRNRANGRSAGAKELSKEGQKAL